MREIPLTQGYVALVDDEDYEELTKHKWYAEVDNHTVYALRNEHIVGTRRHNTIRMHRFLLGVTGESKVDHQDGNGLNNQRSNIRVATLSQNNSNRRKKTGTSSKYKGVHWDKARKKWSAKVHVGDKYYCLGRFTDESEAALAYDIEAKKHFGQFACLNFPQGALNGAENFSIHPA